MLGNAPRACLLLCPGPEEQEIPRDNEIIHPAHSRDAWFVFQVVGDGSQG